MRINKVIPVLRIFNYEKAVEFYVNWLGFTIDWEHRFEDNTPIYMQISLAGMVLHLSEHHGDASPGANVYIECEELKSYHEILINKKYKYNRPGLEKTFYGTWAVTVNDPFYNKITFNEEIKEAEGHKAEG